MAGVLARQPDLLSTLFPPSSHTRSGRRRLVPTLGAEDTARAWLQLRDGSGVDLPDGSFLIEADERAELLPLLHERKESFFVDFADGRRPLFEAMQAATVVGQRHAAITALAAYDAPRLPELVAMRNAMLGRWQVDDTDARDAVLAALQLQAATDAQGELEADFKTVRERVTKATGMGVDSQWCGMFSGDHLIKAVARRGPAQGLHAHPQRRGLLHLPPRAVTRRASRSGSGTTTAGRTCAGTTTPAARCGSGSPTTRSPRAATLDIQPGDMVLLDWELDGDPNHIVLAQSYDPQTNTLVTIGGNDSGYVLMGPKDKEPAKDAKRDTAEAATGLELKPGTAAARWASACTRSPPHGQGEARGRLRGRAPVADRPRGAHLRLQAAGQAATAAEAREVTNVPPPSQPAASETPPRSVPSTTARSRGSA